jgi:hypothetical protein
MDWHNPTSYTRQLSTAYSQEETDIGKNGKNKIEGWKV